MIDPTQFSHKEAFCLMLYRCLRCGWKEQFWNSRDGVTPFCAPGRCPYCGGDMQHINFVADTFAPDHVPHSGQGVWIDRPESLKRPLAIAIARMGEKNGYAIADGDIEEIIASFRPGEPWLIRW